ncbi:hypothetical protein HanIR_Chr13g0669981 [Helianthus annuus]|nr:hypothetical protein HanIR_Chr13g0669981 [Helianthus annuus]
MLYLQILILLLSSTLFTNTLPNHALFYFDLCGKYFTTTTNLTHFRRNHGCI